MFCYQKLVKLIIFLSALFSSDLLLTFKLNKDFKIFLDGDRRSARRGKVFKFKLFNFCLKTNV